MINKIQELVKLLFKNDKGEPFILTEGQIGIFNAIYKKKQKRVHIQTPTRYGKSEVVSMAVLLRASTFPEKWAIVAGNQDKAGIIMGDIIKHIFDNEYTRQRFIIEKGESEERIKRFRNKSKINFKLENGLLGEVYITTAEGALGFGASNVVEDESALISDRNHALVMRMLGDQPDNFLCKIGNPWDMEHFRKSFVDDNYHKIIIDYRQGIQEGRFTEEYINEMRAQPFFNVLYECEFPALDTIDTKGWIPLLTTEDIDRAIVDEAQGFGINKLGVDVAGGGRNYSTIVERRTNVAKLIHKSKDPDTMNLAELVISLDKQARRNGIFTDSVGIGRGVYDIISRQVNGVWAINGGEKPTSHFLEADFVNLRAELCWKMRQWILNGGKLIKNEDWYQLTKLKYRTKLEGTRGKMAIISKEDLLKEGVESPDCFVSGTFILTPSGKKDIKELKEGEKVITPFGNRTIIKKWEIETDELRKVIFSNGSSLTGKPKHKILTKRGFITIDALLLTDIIELRNNFSTLLWKIKKLLFIKEKNIGLRKQADIFMPTSTMAAERKQGKKKHYTAEFGKTIISIKKFQKDIVFTIKTIMSKIIVQKILNWLRIENIVKNILRNDLAMINIKNQTTDNLIISVPLLLYGTNQKSAESGIRNIQKNSGKIQKELKENVLNAEKNLRDIIRQKDFVVYPASKNQSGKEKFIIQMKEFVYFVKKNLWQIGIGIQNVAVESVETITGLKTKVFNLTLDKDNVYYANGVLVENCADALMMTFRTDDTPDIFQGLDKEEIEQLNYQIQQETGSFNLMENL